MTFLPAMACLLCVGTLLRAIVSHDARTAALAKTAASVAMVAFGMTCGVLHAGPAGMAVFAALVASALGDIALISKERVYFLTGLFLFLGAHLGYIVAFRSFGTSPVSVIGTLLIMVAPAWWVMGWVGDAKGMRPAVLVYVAVISVMIAMAVGSAVMSGRIDATWRIGLLGSAVMFYASDLFVARERFVVSEVRNRLAGLPLYYVAQLGFAWFTGLSGQPDTSTPTFLPSGMP
jgi:uncharacterized membrane protein YhhN